MEWHNIREYGNPRKSGDYIAVVHFKYADRPHICQSYYDEKSQSFIYYDGNNGFMTLNVTEWMELPELPEKYQR